MNVLWLTSAYPWEGNPYGGIFVQTQAQALSRLGVPMAVEVTVPWIPTLASWVSPRYARQNAAPRHQTEGALTIHRLSYFGHRFQKYMGRPHLQLARQVLKHLPFRPDLIHGHTAYPMGLAAVEVGRSLGIPSVVTLHGSDVNHFASHSRLGARRFLGAVSGADRVLCVSQALRERTRQLTGVEADYLPIGINLERFQASHSRAQAREALDLPLDRPIVLYIGNLFAFKGVAVALEAMAHAELAGVLGLFVGSGPLAPAVSGRPNCLWRESVPNARIATYLAAADVLILPSYSEGLPTVLVEAGACGTPVIATRVGGIPELLEDDRGTLIEPGSAGALRAAILEALARPDTARARAERLGDHVRKAFDADRNARHLLTIYEALAAQPAPLARTEEPWP